MDVAQEISLFNETVREYREAGVETIVREFKARKSQREQEALEAERKASTKKRGAVRRVKAA